MNSIIKFKEHSESNSVIDDEVFERINIQAQDENENKYVTPSSLGIRKSHNGLRADYYIGVDWLIENEVAAVVEPKINSVDFMSLFSAALSISSDKEVEYFSHYYGIDFSKSEIETDSSIVDSLTPLIIAHYISLLKILIKRGLKGGYIHQEENLHSKIKGKILFQKNLRHNQLTKREDRIYCGFEDYTINIPENRLLKKALIFADKALNNCISLNQDSQRTFYNDIKKTINSIKPHFEQVSSEIQINEVQKVTSNKVFKTYKEAIIVAKALLRKYDYTFSKINEKTTKTYPFWIDMPRLYEMYVYSKLKEKFGEELGFQVEGFGRGEYKTAADFILRNKGLILDAKYKPRYEHSKSGIITDIRELSGYARDMKILQNFDNCNQNNEVPCVIIYPGQSAIEDFLENELPQSDIENKTDAEYMNFISDKNKFKAFRNFYFYKLSLPALKSE